jgi:hypothetical protein
MNLSEYQSRLAGLGQFVLGLVIQISNAAVIKLESPNTQPRGAEGVTNQNGIAEHVGVESDKKRTTYGVSKVNCDGSVNSKWCPRCKGTQLVANTPSMESWLFWKTLQEKLNRAIETGALRPIQCPDCANNKETINEKDQT